MSDPNYFILYVDRPAVSAAFYEKLLGKSPVASSPAFALFALKSGVMFGLWARDDVKPDAATSAGGGEVAFTVDGPASVDATCADWVRLGINIIQPPSDLGFGRAFTALDPDGHRLRVFAPAGA